MLPQLTNKVYFKSMTRGLVLTLGKGLKPAVFEPNFQKDTQGGYGICALDKKLDEARIKAIMDHPVFKSGGVVKLKTPEEIALAKAIHAGKVYAFKLKESMNEGLRLDFTKVEEEKLQEFANKCGISAVDEDGKNKTGAQLKKEIKEAIESAEDPGEFDLET